MERDWTQSGLMWIRSRAVPWVCESDVHIYSLQLAPPFWRPPDRHGLRWFKYVSEAPGPDCVYVQVRASDGEVSIRGLWVDNRPLGRLTLAR